MSTELRWEALTSEMTHYEGRYVSGWRLMDGDKCIGAIEWEAGRISKHQGCWLVSGRYQPVETVEEAKREAERMAGVTCDE